LRRSAPYFHDGSAKTLEEAVDIMLAGGKENQYLDKKNLQPHKLLPEQREDLLNFLRSLSVDCKIDEATATAEVVSRQQRAGADRRSCTWYLLLL
jgi:cytochrome c peroxidase